MAAGRILFPGFMPCEDAAGDRVAGAKAYFYLNGTATLTTVYADSGLLTALPNPVVADSVGTWPAIWADTSLYFNVALTDAAGVPLTGASWSGVGPAIDATTASAALALAAQTAAETARDQAQAAEAQAEAVLAETTGEPFNATSSTSRSIGSGTKTFVLNESGKLYSVGQTVVAAVTALPLNQMVMIVTAFDPVTKTLTGAVQTSASPDGAGPYAAWTISLGSVSGVSPSRAISAAGLATGGGDLTADRTITVTAAAAADVRTGTNTSKAVTSGALSGSAAFITLTDAATVAWDVSGGFNAKVTLGGNRVIGAPTNLLDGVTYVLDLIQDATGSRVPTWNAIWDFGQGGAPTLNTAAGKVDSVVAQYKAHTGKLHASFRKAA